MCATMTKSGVGLVVSIITYIAAFIPFTISYSMESQGLLSATVRVLLVRIKPFFPLTILE